MSEVHAAIGLSQFARLEEFISDRRRIAKIYDEGLTEMNGVTPLKVPPEGKSNYYKYVAFLQDGSDRPSLKKELKEQHDVGLSGEVYELPCHLQPIFRDQHYSTSGRLTMSESLCQNHICLPVFARMTEEEGTYVLDSLKEVVR
jgi:dTDP-4-amino-4,6-dideoxygalactose transaminase